MPNMIAQALRNRWVVIAIHASLWLLLYLVASNLVGKAPAYGDVRKLAAEQALPPLARMEALFAPDNSPTNRFLSLAAPNLFFTEHYVPAPAPAPPPPPTTRKIELTYVGFYQTAQGAPQTMIQFTNTYLVAPLGGQLLSNLYVASVSLQSASLTNTESQTNLLPVNVKKIVEVPVK